MKFIRFGGSNKVRQKNKRAPKGRGIWCFPLGLADDTFLAGTDKLRDVGEGENARVKPVRSSIFEYKGPVWVGTEDIPFRYLAKALSFSFRSEGGKGDRFGDGKEWALLPYEVFCKVVAHHKKADDSRRAAYTFKVEKVNERFDGRIVEYRATCSNCGSWTFTRKGEDLRKALPDKCPVCFRAKKRRGLECFIE